MIEPSKDTMERILLELEDLREMVRRAKKPQRCSWLLRCSFIYAADLFIIESLRYGFMLSDVLSDDKVSAADLNAMISDLKQRIANAV